MRKRVFPLQDEESSGASSSTDVQHKIIWKKKSLKNIIGTVVPGPVQH